eukprot:14158524-Alexandrium_andersonii.AAC.1
MSHSAGPPEVPGQRPRPPGRARRLPAAHRPTFSGSTAPARSASWAQDVADASRPVSYTHLRAHETSAHL